MFQDWPRPRRRDPSRQVSIISSRSAPGSSRSAPESSRSVPESSRPNPQESSRLGYEISSRLEPHELFETEQRHFADLLVSNISQGYRCATSRLGEDEAAVYEQSIFLRNDVLDDLINEEILRERIFGRLLHPTKRETRHYLEQILGSREQARRAIVLVILCYGRYSMLEKFENHFLKGSTQVFDTDLPLKTDKAMDIFGNDGQLFHHQQFKLLPITLVDNTSNQFDFRRPLPYLRQTKIGEGQHGTVYRVEVEKGHYSTADGRVNRDVVVLARKDFATDDLAKKAFKAENKVLKDVINAKSPQNIAIVRSICSFTFTGTNQCFGSIFFEQAICSLEDFIRDDQYRPISGTQQRQDNRSLKMQWQNIHGITGICKALVWLSEKSAADDDFPYYHCDVKPANILVCTSGKGEDDPWVFKLADFGEAQQRKKENALWAKFRSDNSTTRWKGTYSDKTNGQNSEVWSFGCVLLAVLIFNRDGKTGIEIFEEARRRDPSDNTDHFYNAKGNGCKKSVTDCMNDLIESGGGPAAQSLRKPFVTYVKKSMLVNHSSRHSLKDIRSKLQKMLSDSTCVEVKLTKHDVPEGITYCTNKSNGAIFYHAPKAVHMYHEYDNLKDSIHADVNCKWSPTIRPRYHSSSNHAIFLAETSYGDLKIVQYEPSEHFGVPTFRTITSKSLQLVALSPDVRRLALVYSLGQHYSAQIRIFDMSSVQGVTLDNARVEGHVNENLRSVDSNRDLFFSSDGAYLYHAYKPRGSAELKIEMWDTFTSQRTAIWKIPNQDTTLNGFFITSIVPLNTQAGFIYVSHGESVEKTTASSTKEKTILAKIASVKKILLSADDERIVILVTRDKGLEIYGLILSRTTTQPIRFKTDRPPGNPAIPTPKKLNILEPMTYDHRKDDAALQEEGLNMSLLVTNCEKKTTYKCNLQSLFETQTEE
ncbi:kinase-like domain-containing protein [Ilyonectria sp. MPI-CAGE-AT-0026]|nr:kinase-like domain-containing protein [Ilyonectria sp. MPI-CAGE-AT-0026]